MACARGETNKLGPVSTVEAMTDSMYLDRQQQRIGRFSDARDRAQFHTPKDLAAAIARTASQTTYAS